MTEKEARSVMDVYGVTVTFQPFAACNDRVWTCGPATHARMEAKRHVADNPDHIVTVETVTRSVYTIDGAKDGEGWKATTGHTGVHTPAGPPGTSVPARVGAAAWAQP